MSLDKEQIKSLLGTGLSNEVVASAVGCDPSYITQLMSDSQFSQEVVVMRAAALTANSKRDRKIDAVEDTLIAKFEEVLPMVYKPTDVLRAMSVVNNMKRRGVPANEALTINNRIVNLNMPVQIIQNFTKNSNGEVIEVEGKTLVTMPSQTLLSTLASSRGEATEENGQQNKFAKVSRYLPSAAVDQIKRTGS